MLRANTIITWKGSKLETAELKKEQQQRDGSVVGAGNPRQRLPPYPYKLKQRWAVKLNFLSGITIRPWLALLVRHWRSIDWLTYPHRVLFLSFMAVMNSVMALTDWLFFSSAVAAQPLHPEPLFILGHPRTGTTHLHNLLSTDPRFAFATTFHAGFPSSFLSLEPVRWLLAGLLESRRPMDHMALDWDLPAEDEIAVNVLTGGDSPYMSLVLPRLWRSLLRSYLSFGFGEAEDGQETTTPTNKSATTTTAPAAMRVTEPTATTEEQKGAAAVATGVDGPVVAAVAAGAPRSDPRVTAAFRRWLAAFMWFMKKVTYRHVRRTRRQRSSPSSPSSPSTPPPPPPPLLIKSPVHTARLAIWRRLFPRARYVFVHRHPVEVFQSAANMADTYYWYTYLQRPTDTVTNDFIMDQYEIMYRSYMSERQHIPDGRLVEVSFADLDSDPIAVLRRIYQEFGWDEHFEVSEPRFRSYLEGLADFKKNHFNRLSQEAEDLIRERWRESFTAFGYDT